MLALLALVASVLIWAAPSSQAQSNQAPFADAGSDQTLNPSTPGTTVTVGLEGTASIDIDGATPPAGITGCLGCSFKWEIETGPYDWIEISNDDNAGDGDTTDTPDLGADPSFNMPSEAFVDKVSDSDPQKFEIVVRLTVTDNDGATDSDTVSIFINQRPVADIQLYAGLRDEDIVDADLGKMGHFPIDAVIDGPGENGNRDNEWDIMEGAWLQLDGSASTDENPASGKPSVYQWSLERPASVAGYSAPAATASATGQLLEVAVAADTDGDSNTGNTSGEDNVTVISFGDLNDDGDTADANESLTVATLPEVKPNAPQTVFYQLTVCDSPDDPAPLSDITTAANCTNGRTGATLIRIVVHDTSATPEVEIGAALTAASTARGDADPQETVGEFTGVENRFIVGAGSTVLLTATVTDDDQSSGHTFRWSGANAVSGTTSTATVRVPADADDGDTIDGSVTVTDATRISVTTEFQLLVGENTEPTAGGVEANVGLVGGPLSVHQITDGFQNRKDGSTVTLRGVGNDADGDSIITAWALREATSDVMVTEGAVPTPTTANPRATAARDLNGDGDTNDTFDGNSALQAIIEAWMAAKSADPSVQADIATATAQALGIFGMVAADGQGAEDPLFELEGALTDTVSFEVPNLENGENAGTLLLFSVIDSKGVAAAQFVYIYVTADDDPPDAKAGDDQQVEPGAFVRLNGSASSDPDVGDDVTHKWEYVGATVDPAPDQRSPLTAAEIEELDGWILDADSSTPGSPAYIVNAAGLLTGESDNLKSTTSAYPWFDAPKLGGFNDIKLTFKLHVKDEPGTDLDGDGNTSDTFTGSGSPVVFDETTDSVDWNGDGDELDIDAVPNETALGLDLNGDGDAADKSVITDIDEANVAAVDSDIVTITIVNVYFSGDIPGPGFCANKSLGGPSTYPFDSDRDGVADVCALNTTRRATVARQNALDALANLNPGEFRQAVQDECDEPGFKQGQYGDDPDDLASDACETGRVSPPPAGVDPATADVFFSGVITGADFCTNHSLGGARTYPNDIDGDGVADQCSLSTTRREAIARQRALDTFIVTFSGADQDELDDLNDLLALSLLGNSRAGDDITDYSDLYNQYVATSANHATDLTPSEQTDVEAAIKGLEDLEASASRYSNALAAQCRALGTQDFGDAASALARDACVTTPDTGAPLS